MRSHTRLCIVEPWFKESHKALFLGIKEHTKLKCDLVMGKGRKWRWCMRTGAIHLAEKLRALKKLPDVLLVSDYVNLPTLMGLHPPLTDIPKAVYFLENQLTYPTRDGKQSDFEFIAINIATCLCADRVVFCSENQKNAMLSAIPDFMVRDGETNAGATQDSIEKKSTVIPIGVDLSRFDRAREKRPDRSGKPLRLVWPHRFEHDKNPDDFFEVVLSLADEGLEFELAVVGRSYRDLPTCMTEAKEKLGKHITEFGFLEGDEYANALANSDVVVSTAWQETQGIAVIEAVRAGCDPLLPNRLSYPEVLGSELSKKHLYTSKGDLRRRLRWMIRNKDFVRKNSDHWSQMERFGWETIASQFDEMTVDLSSTLRT